MKRTALVLTGVALMGASLGFSPLLGEAATPVLKSGSHCVAWKTNKTLALVKRATAVGTSCNVTVKAVKSGANLGAEISVPIASFKSGEKAFYQTRLSCCHGARRGPSSQNKCGQHSLPLW